METSAPMINVDAITLCSTPTHTLIRCRRGPSYPVLFSGRLAAPDFIMKYIKVRAVQWPEIWKFVPISYIIAFSPVNKHL